MQQAPAGQGRRFRPIAPRPEVPAANRLPAQQQAPHGQAAQRPLAQQQAPLGRNGPAALRPQQQAPLHGAAAPAAQRPPAQQQVFYGRDRPAAQRPLAQQQIAPPRGGAAPVAQRPPAQQQVPHGHVGPAVQRPPAQQQVGVPRAPAVPVAQQQAPVGHQAAAAQRPPPRQPEVYQLPLVRNHVRQRQQPAPASNDIRPGQQPQPLNDDTDQDNTQLTQSHINDVFKSMHRFQRQQTFCDITLKVGETTFSAHKVVLASSSEYFSTMFTSNFQESRETEVNISGSADAFKVLLEFIYSGELNVTADVARNDPLFVMDVLKLAHYIQLNQVTSRCEKMIVGSFDVLNLEQVLQILSECEVFELHKLKSRCADYLAQNFRHSDDFTQSMTMDFMVKIMDSSEFKVEDEQQVFDTIIAWLQHDWENRKQFAPELFQRLRLGAIPLNHLTLTYIQTTELNAIPECQAMVVKVIQLHNAKKVDDPPLSVSHPTLFAPRSTITALFRYRPRITQIHRRPMYYDTETQSWVSLPRFVHLMIGHMLGLCVGTQGQLFVASTEADHGPSAFLSYANRRMKVLAEMVKSRENGRLCLVSHGDNHIYAIGGAYEAGESGIQGRLSCEMYNIDDNTWREKAAIPEVVEVWPNSAISYEGMIFVYGENQRNHDATRLQFSLVMYDPRLNSWYHLATHEYNHAALSTDSAVICTAGLIAQDGRLYRIVGGYSSGFAVHELIINMDNNHSKNSSCISNPNHRQDQSGIPGHLGSGAFRIDQTVYVLCGSGYHKQEVKVGAIDKEEERLLQISDAALSKDYVLMYTFDKDFLTRPDTDDCILYGPR